MTLIVTEPREKDRLIAERRAAGGDRFDEVWEGDYVTTRSRMTNTRTSS